MATIEELLRRQSAAKGWLTRSVNELQDLLRDNAFDSELLENAVSVFDKRLAVLDDLQAAVELERDLADLEADIDETNRFHMSARQVRSEAAKRLKGVSTEADNASFSSKDKSEVKLPRLELPKYSGDLTEWQSFWERLVALADQSLLNVSFGPRSKGAYVESLWKLQDQLLRHVRSLEALGISGDQYGVVLTPVILSRIPLDMRLEWSRESAGHESDLEWLLKFLQKEIQRHERSETFKELSMEKNVRQEAERKKVSSALALQASSGEGPPKKAIVKVLTGGGKCVEAVVMFDLGADTTYVSHIFVRRIKPKWVTSKYTSYSAFGDGKSKNMREQNVYDVNLIDTQSNNLSILAVELAEDYGHDRDLTSDILIGVDYYWRFIKAVFGYILSGSCLRAHEESISHQLLCINIANNVIANNVNESDLHKFWSLESVGINVEKDNPPKDPVLDTFEGTIEYVNGRPVIKDNISSKVWSVFDASAKGPDGISLNGCVESGPSLIPDLVEVLLRFRRWNIALTGDTVKALLQIGVQRPDQDVHRFLWQCGNIVRVTKFVRVPFGNISSPFLLNATIKYHLELYNNSVTAQELKENLYVDDWLSGVDTVEEASRMFSEAQSKFLDAGMTLSKWHTNNDFLINQHYQYFEPELEDVTKLLGMYWNFSDDVSFKGLNLGSNFEFNYTKKFVKFDC
ncbi:uncharacterized protein [Macrobrachium rosenbergii]|uniref:uncharacterized protein n=1 Tax=Macrobrachium rosenbergii TaxID=79674 RepID=UPI0034D76817